MEEFKVGFTYNKHKIRKIYEISTTLTDESGIVYKGITPKNIRSFNFLPMFYDFTIMALFIDNEGNYHYTIKLLMSSFNCNRVSDDSQGCYKPTTI